jgi:hypothetical protein
MVGYIVDSRAVEALWSVRVHVDDDVLTNGLGLWWFRKMRDCKATEDLHMPVGLQRLLLICMF